MSIFSAIGKKLAPTVTSLARNFAKKTSPKAYNAAKSAGIGVLKGAGTIVKETGELGQGAINLVNKGLKATTGKTFSNVSDGRFISGSPSNIALNKALTGNNSTEKGFSFGTQVAGAVNPRSILKAPSTIGRILSNAPKVSSGFPSAATNFAEKMADVSTKYAGKTGNGTTVPRVSNAPLKSGSVDQRVFSDIKPPSAKPNVTTKTNTARDSTLDTRTTPTKVNTTKTNIPVKNADAVVPKKAPWGKIGLGAGATALGVSALMPGEQTAQPNSFVEPNYNGANFASAQGQANNNSQGLAPNDVFGGDFGNNEGGVFESSTPAPQTGTAMGGSFQPGFTSVSRSGGASSFGVGTGIGGSGGGRYKSDTEQYIDEDEKKRRYRTDAEDRAVAFGDRQDAKSERDALRAQQATDLQDRQIQDYNKRIADLMNRQAGYGIDLETSAASSSARNGLADMFDRETRKSLIPLQTSLALVQAERERADTLRQQEFENNLAMNPVGSEDNAFTLGAGQTRFALNPATGQYEQIGSVEGNEKTSESPTSIQEYEYARNQGYQGTYNDFQQQSSSDTQTGDKLLSPYEAASLGVPYGTTQSQAYGQNPSKLSGDAAKVQAIASTMIPEINALKQRFQQNYKGALTGFLTGTDRELVKLIDQVADKVGRLRSGGAVNADEEERFKRQIASFMDLPFGNSQQAIDALDGLINEAQQVSSSIDPYYQGSNMQSTGGGTWGW